MHPEIFNVQLKIMILIIKYYIVMVHIYLFFDTYFLIESDKLTYT